jgi:estrogen-related receptor beta like 1|eukprot:SAG25_NODE_364_length_9141_cov_5.390732_6_plen_425_part_00
MSDQEPERQRREVPPSAPATPDPFVLMEEVLEKLKILDYEKEFCVSAQCGLLSRIQFAMPSNNPAQNFNTFAALVHWLMTLNGSPTQYNRNEDPNVTVTNMTNSLRGVGINMDIPPHKLKQGHGSEVCSVLNSLVDVTLQKRGFIFGRPRHHPDAYAEEMPTDDGARQIYSSLLPAAIAAVQVLSRRHACHTWIPCADGGMGDEMGEEIADASVAEDEEEEMYVAAPSDAAYGQEDRLESSMLESKVDPHQWRMELERVAPQLKVVLHSSAKEWRSHLDQAVSLEKQIDAAMSKTLEPLGHIMTEVSEALEKISGREKVVNQNFDHIISEFRNVKEQLLRLQEQYDGSSGTIQNLTRELAQVSDELSHVKSTMDKRGNSMTDTSPLIDIKKALSRIKTEAKQMDLRIGAVEHTLLTESKKAMKT